MGGYTERFMKLLLGWMKTLFDSLWGIVGSEDSGLFFQWLSKSWWLVALVIIGGGLAADWVIWMIRWQPYHIWATRLRRIRRLFTRASQSGLESEAQYTTQYAMARGGYDQTQAYGATPGGDGDAYQDAYAQAGGFMYAADGYEEDDVYAGETYAGDEAFDEDTESLYAEEDAYYDAPVDDGYDAQQAYRRPEKTRFSMPDIPDTQLRDYPGRRYDPNRMPYQPPQAPPSRPQDPLAPYDAYAQDAWTDAYYEEDADGQTLEEMAELDAGPVRETRWTNEAPMGGGSMNGAKESGGRRTRRKTAGDTHTEQRRLYGRPQEEGSTQASPPAHEEDAGRRRRRTQRAMVPEETAVEDVGSYSDTDAPAWDGADWDVDQLPEPPRWPTWDARAPGKPTKKKSLVGRVLSPGDGRTKKRGKLAQIFDPQEETVKSLPPRVDQRHAFYEPAYPQPDEDWGPDEGEDE